MTLETALDGAQASVLERMESRTGDDGHQRSTNAIPSRSSRCGENRSAPRRRRFRDGKTMTVVTDMVSTGSGGHKTESGEAGRTLRSRGSASLQKPPPISGGVCRSVK